MVVVETSREKTSYLPIGVAPIVAPVAPIVDRIVPAFNVVPAMSVVSSTSSIERKLVAKPISALSIRTEPDPVVVPTPTSVAV